MGILYLDSSQLTYCAAYLVNVILTYYKILEVVVKFRDTYITDLEIPFIIIIKISEKVILNNRTNVIP